MYYINFNLLWSTLCHASFKFRFLSKNRLGVLRSVPVSRSLLKQEHFSATGNVNTEKDPPDDVFLWWDFLIFQFLRFRIGLGLDISRWVEIYIFFNYREKWWLKDRVTDRWVNGSSPITTKVPLLGPWTLSAPGILHYSWPCALTWQRKEFHCALMCMELIKASISYIKSKWYRNLLGGWPLRLINLIHDCAVISCSRWSVWKKSCGPENSKENSNRNIF